MSDFEKALDSFVVGCNKIYNDYMDVSCPTLDREPKAVVGGRKYIKIASIGPDGESRSVFCFVNKENGDVLKAAGWKAPAKGARGNIFDENNGLGRIDQYGPGYNR